MSGSCQMWSHTDMGVRGPLQGLHRARDTDETEGVTRLPDREEEHRLVFTLRRMMTPKRNVSKNKRSTKMFSKLRKKLLNCNYKEIQNIFIC